MQPWYRNFLYLFTFGVDLFGWGVLAIISKAWGQGIKWQNGNMTVWLKEGSWPTKTWFKKLAGLTFGHACLFAPDVTSDSPVISHEFDHVTQIETNGLAGTILCLILVWMLPWWLTLIIWVTFPGLIYVSASLVALLQGKSAYKDNSLEVAARAEAGEQV